MSSGGLGPNTKTTLGVAASSVTVFLGGALWIADSMNSVEKAVGDLSHRIDLIDYRIKTLETRGDGSLSGTTFRVWVSDLKERNPSLSVPAVQ